MFQPMTPSVPGYRWLRVASTRGPATASRSARAEPTATTAAAPSPNSPLATRLAIEVSPRWIVSEHSSTDSSMPT